MKIKWIKLLIIIVGILIGTNIIIVSQDVFAANIMSTVIYSFTIVENQVDIEAPIVSWCVPQAESIDVPLSTNIQASIVDLGSAVVSSSITMEVNGIEIIRNGTIQSYQNDEGIGNVNFLLFSGHVME